MNIRSFDELHGAGEPILFSFKGLDIPLKFKAGSSDELVVLFHGVIHRESRDFPAFERFLPINSHQIALADPALVDHPSIIGTWFLGAEGRGQVEKISEFIRGLVGHLGIRRVVFVGGSSGGFAALLYSYLHPGSVAIAVSPQTRLKTYYSKFAEEFRQALWPSSKSFDDLEYADLVRHYAKGTQNYPIVVMSSRDTGHLYHQVFPFVGGLPDSMYNKFILDVGFWNVLGHPNSVPKEQYLHWLRAAISAPELNADTLSRTHFALQSDVTRPEQPRVRSLETSASDIAKADLIGAYLLRGNG